jgi:hypothetical protein
MENSHMSNKVLQPFYSKYRTCNHVFDEICMARAVCVRVVPVLCSIF